jgi:murein DD-endopeptidase MepM/ murein hydrolase activator NlpD
MFKRSLILALIFSAFLLSYAYPFTNDFSGKIKLITSSDFKEIPLIKLVSVGGVFAQGKTAYLDFISSKSNLNISGTFQKKDFRAYPYKKMYRAVIGFSIDKPGNKDYLMILRAKDPAGNLSVYGYGVRVAKTWFKTLNFALKPAKMKKLQPDIIEEDWKPIEAEVIKENPEKYLAGKFIRPATGRISMPFGLRENINGAESGRHRGMDLAAAAGSPIIASNSGIVRLARMLPAHGNVVVIDHGQGIFTYYAHMSKILVTAGEKVKKGQQIGRVGSTGVATGPHLHFSVSLHNLRVDPEQWLGGVIID